MTLAELIGKVRRRLAGAKLHFGHGSDNARDEAAFIVLRGLKLPFDTNLQRQVPKRALAQVEMLVRRRIGQRIPASYLLREAWLGEHSFYVDERVIVPRSHIAELLREHLEPWREGPVRRILDLCTGSGCLAIVAAHEFPRARVVAADISPGALAVARKNVARHRLQRRVRIVRSDLFRNLGRQRFDVIVTNPPYVPPAAMRALPREYRHEPKLALAGGKDGLQLVRRILDEAPGHLSPGGLLVCEIGDNRRALERARPDEHFVWPEVSAGAGPVFLLRNPPLR